MLRLSVSRDEYLMVGTEVRITVLKVNERSVELMIDAPREQCGKRKSNQKACGRKRGAADEIRGKRGLPNLTANQVNNHCRPEDRRRKPGSGGYYK